MKKNDEIIQKVLLNQATPEESSEVAAWFMSPEGQMALSNAMDKDFEAAFGKERTVSSHRMVHTWFWHAAAAVIVLVMGFAGAWIYNQYHRLTSSTPLCVTTGVGERSVVILPDGTKVSLNTMSRIEYDCDLTSGKRLVHFEGEGFFDVAKDKKHPFIVDCGGMEVECLGTMFNVRNYTDEQTASVVLVDGKVRVSTEYGDMTMEPNSRVECNKESFQMSKTSVLASNYTYWLHGEIRYNDQSLEDIARELARNYHIKIIITGDELKKQHFTGYLGTCSLRNVLDILTITSDMGYQIEGDSVYIYARNKNN